jgi:hypothetical protein
MLSAVMDPKNTYTLFSVEDICRLVDKFYPGDFLDQRKNLVEILVATL